MERPIDLLCEEERLRRLSERMSDSAEPARERRARILVHEMTQDRRSKAIRALEAGLQARWKAVVHEMASEGRQAAESKLLDALDSVTVRSVVGLRGLTEVPRDVEVVAVAVLNLLSSEFLDQSFAADCEAAAPRTWEDARRVLLKPGHFVSSLRKFPTAVEQGQPGHCLDILCSPVHESPPSPVPKAASPKPVRSTSPRLSDQKSSGPVAAVGKGVTNGYASKSTTPAALTSTSSRTSGFNMSWSSLSGAPKPVMPQRTGRISGGDQRVAPEPPVITGLVATPQVRSTKSPGPFTRSRSAGRNGKGQELVQGKNNPLSFASISSAAGMQMSKDFAAMRVGIDKEKKEAHGSMLRE
eukprot:Skav225919  [mRNA]  locus=scaffold1500:207407:214995:- [translate_table: standard]